MKSLIKNLHKTILSADNIFDDFYNDVFGVKKWWDSSSLNSLTKTNKDLTAKFNIPDFRKEEIQVEYSNGYVVITARNSVDLVTDMFFVGENVDVEKAVAKLQNGILEVCLPYKEKEKPRNIKIT